MLDVAPGTTLRSLAERLEATGVIDSARIWSVYMRMRGLDRHLRQGKIRFRTPMTPEEVARYATTRLGRINIRVLIPEGFNRFDIAGRLEEFGVCGAEDFLEATEDSSLLASYGVEANDAEGYLFPDTYEFDDRTNARRVVERMLANWSRRYEELQEAYATELAEITGRLAGLLEALFDDRCRPLLGAIDHAVQGREHEIVGRDHAVIEGLFGHPATPVLDKILPCHTDPASPGS